MFRSDNFEMHHLKNKLGSSMVDPETNSHRTISPGTVNPKIVLALATIRPLRPSVMVRLGQVMTGLVRD
jgi:hypothetical protein